ncbi:MAG: YdcF family protein [Pseudomonadota bacterium]
MDTALFILSKIVGFGLRVENWLILGFALCIFAMFAGRMKLAKWAGAITLIFTVLISVFPFGILLLHPLETAYPQNPLLDRVDGIVVLGGAEYITGTDHWGQTQLNHSAERLTETAALALRFRNAKVVISGGSGRLRDTFDATAGEPSGARDLLISLGVLPNRILWENRSRNTAENARYSLATAKPQPEQRWVLITSAFHMDRSLSSFRAAGWPAPVPYPVDYRSESFIGRIGWSPINNIELLNTAIKEHVGRLSYRIMGR